MNTMRIRRSQLPVSPLVVVTLSDGTDAVDDRVVTLAREEAQREGLALVTYLGILDEPDAGILCHVFAAQKQGKADGA